MPQRRIALQVHALHFQQLLRRRAGLGGKARSQALAHRQQHGIGQGRGVRALGRALLFLVAQPEAPFRLPLRAILMGVHGEQGVGAITLGRRMQWRGIGAFEVLGGRDDLFIQVGQGQAQWQATMLRGTAQRFGGRLPIAHQARTLGGIAQPPAENRRSIAAPQGQPGTTQGAIGTHRIEIHLQALRRPSVVAVLADDLLRILAHLGQPRALRRLGIAGEAQHQGFQRALGSLVTLIGGLAADRLADLIQAVQGFGMNRQAQQGKTTDTQ